MIASGPEAPEIGSVIFRKTYGPPFLSLSQPPSHHTLEISQSLSMANDGSMPVLSWGSELLHKIASTSSDSFNLLPAHQQSFPHISGSLPNGADESYYYMGPYNDWPTIVRFDSGYEANA